MDYTQGTSPTATDEAEGERTFSFAAQETAPAAPANAVQSGSAGGRGGSGGSGKGPSFGPAGGPQRPKVAEGVLTRAQVCEAASAEVIEWALAQPTRPELKAVGSMLLSLIGSRITEQNLLRTSVQGYPKLPHLHELKSAEVVSVLLALRTIARVSLTGKKHADEFDIVAMYQEDGDLEGVHLDSEKDIRALLMEINPHSGDRGTDEAMNVLRVRAPFRAVCKDPDLVPVQNGVFCHSTQELLEHSPERVFLMKRPVRYDEQLDLTKGAPKVVEPDGTEWDVDEWMAELHDDPEVVQVYWQLISASIRSNVAWDKAAFLYSPYGSNGKGTLTRMIRGLVGEDHTASIQMTEFGDRFALGGLTRACAIIVDENDVGGYTEKGSRFKAVVTGDRFQIERKHKDPGDIAFRGMVIQCINDFPRAKDKSDSFARRQLFVPFDKRFEGRENKAIKEHYVVDPKVQEYVMKKALHMQHTELNEPDACRALKDVYRRENDSVRDFWHEHEALFMWDLLPTTFLYSLYKSWLGKTNPRGAVLSQQSFLRDLGQVLDKDPSWDFSDPSRRIRWKGRMDVAEPLIGEHDLDEWLNPQFNAQTQSQAAYIPSPAQASYRGVLRKGTLQDHVNARAALALAHGALGDEDGSADMDADFDTPTSEEGSGSTP